MNAPVRAKKIPGPDHPIALAAAGKRMRVMFRGEIVAESYNALIMHEASYPPVVYFPRGDVRMEKFARTEHHTWCPYKGEASYYTLAGAQENTVWTYETPFEAVEGIRERIAFYPNKVDAIEEA